MHPNPSSSIQVFRCTGMPSHADLNVNPAHTDVKVKTAGGIRARGRMTSAAASESVRMVAAAAGGLAPVGESTFRGQCVLIFRHWSLRVNPRMGTPIEKHLHSCLASAPAGESA